MSMPRYHAQITSSQCQRLRNELTEPPGTDERTDMRALGLCLHRALTGLRPWASVESLDDMALTITSEEPGLEKRFGAEYVEYKRNVPRWIPRLKPWRPQ